MKTITTIFAVFVALTTQAQFTTSAGALFGRGGYYTTFAAGYRINRLETTAIYNFGENDFYGVEGMYHFIDGNVPVDISTGIQLGVYNRILGFSFPQLCSSYKTSEKTKVSLVLSPDRIEVRMKFINFNK